MLLAIDAINIDPVNARTHSKKNIEAIKTSLSRFGQRLPIVVQKKGMVVRAGNARVIAAKDLGWSHIAAIVVNESDLEATAYGIADNRTAELAEWDDAALVQTLAQLQKEDASAAIATGFSMDEIERLLAKAGIANFAQEPEVPEIPLKPITQAGDVWELGPHRLVCGDSSDQDVIGALVGNVAVQMIFTDPPWNVAIGKNSNPKWRQREGLENDDLGADFSGFLTAWSSACLPYLKGDLYCVMGCGEWPAIDASLRDAGMHWSGTLVWLKDSFVIGRSNYHRRFEPIWYGWPAKIKSSFIGGRDQDDVWEFHRPKVSAEHPTMKPIALVEKAIRNSSCRGGNVFDPFLGSGTTLLAAERTERVCHA